MAIESRELVNIAAFIRIAEDLLALSFRKFRMDIFLLCCNVFLNPQLLRAGHILGPFFLKFEKV